MSDSIKWYTVEDLSDDAKPGAFLAKDYHGGQWTALYALASSGSLELYKGEGLGRIISELRDAIEIAETIGEPQDLEDLRALLSWCEQHHGTHCG